ncbi:hypothetical protein D3C87_1207740 [compost metagenome]
MPQFRLFCYSTKMLQVNIFGYFKMISCGVPGASSKSIAGNNSIFKLCPVVPWIANTIFKPKMFKGCV